MPGLTSAIQVDDQKDFYCVHFTTKTFSLKLQLVVKTANEEKIVSPMLFSFFFWDHVYTWTKLKYLLLFIPFFFVNIWWESWWILLICRTCNHMSNIANLQIFSKVIVSKKCFPGFTRNLRFPLENLGVAPVLCRSSSQTLYLCVGVNIGVSSILWCDLHAIETTNVPTSFFYCRWMEW